MTTSKTWCVNAFHSLQANNSGGTRACCMYDPQHAKLKLGEDSLVDHFNSIDLIQLRKDAAEGIRNPGCHRCWQEEDGGRDSKRIRDNLKYKERKEEWHGLAYLELNLGNQCNLRCKTCNPQASSQWAKEAYDTVYLYRIDYKSYNERLKMFHNSYDDESTFWAEFENVLPTIRQLDFYGGEPFMAKKMWRILQSAVSKEYAKDIELHFNTNGSFWPDNVSLFQHFKSVSVAFSIDGIGNKFEFTRYLSNWEVAKENIMKARLTPNIKISWCVTLSTLNIYDLPNILEEYQNHYSDIGLYLNLVHNPEHFNISIMPDDIKSKVIDKLNSVPKNNRAWNQLPGIIGFIENGKYNPEYWANFLTNVRMQDHYRNENYAEIYPEFSKLIGYVK